jgi:hypothetical protein
MIDASRTRLVPTMTLGIAIKMVNAQAGRPHPVPFHDTGAQAQSFRRRRRGGTEVGAIVVPDFRRILAR